MLKAIAPSFSQTSDRNSPQTKQRSPIFSDTLNVQSYRPLIPQTNDRKSPQINQRSPISSDTLNVQSDRPLIPQTKDRNSSQIKQRSPIFIIKNQQGDRINNLYAAIMNLMKFRRVWL